MMVRALRLAERGLWTTTPKPRVGGVLLRDGEVVSEGWHEKAAEPHAEFNGLRAAGDRARACAVLTGIGTVRDDDPQLSVREVDTPRQPLRVVVDSKLEIPLGAKILRGGPVLVAAAVDDEKKANSLRAAGAEVVVLPDRHGKVELKDLLEELGRRGINEVHGEAGFKLNGSLLREGLVDELLLYLAPCLIGHQASGLFNLPELTSLDGKCRLEIRDLRQIGEDIRLIARLR